MARRKHNEDLLDRLLANFSLYNIRRLLFHPATLFVGVTLLMIGGAIHAWEKYQHKIVDSVATQLTPEKINVNQPPAWAKTDLRRAIIGSTDQQLSILDPKLIPHTVETFRSVGWIEDIEQIKKSSDGLDIQLNYREPVAAVEMNDNTVRGWAKNDQLLLVDRNGVLMPPETAQGSVAIPKICISHAVGQDLSVQQYLTQLHTWSAWPDVRVHDAALLGSILQNDWQSLGLHRIVTMRFSNSADDPTIPYQLWTQFGERDGVRVIWGNAPGKEQPNEATWETKLAALKDYVQKNGPLNQISDRTINVYNGAVVIVETANVSQSELFSNMK